ncbi:GNAT family N-acetyltransferase [Kitasatospora purpeofusca]|uniref:GNAT family N-acetyltransferase n=1 Tax=Kitasatospora purpeofusca TaxID=67352 RepID=UPI0030F01362
MTEPLLLTLSRGGSALVDVGFRPAAEQDAEALHALSEPFMVDGSLVPRAADVYSARYGEFFVLEVDGHVVACAGVDRCADPAEIYNFAVHSEWQRLGLGRVLLGALLRELRGATVDEVVLLSSATVPWFERHGFVRMDRRELPAERTARIDPARGSVPLRRHTVGGFDPVDVLARIGGARVRFERSGVEHLWDHGFDSLLQFADHHGIETESRCWAGACGTCRSGLARGTVSYHIEPGPDLDGRDILLCTSQPVTDLVLDL